MEIKNNLILLQSESKHLKKLKQINETMISNYENDIFPSTIEKYFQNILSLIFIQTKNNINNKDQNSSKLKMDTKIQLNKELHSIEQSRTLLGSYYQVISDFFLSLRKNEKIMLNIIKNIKGESQNMFINYISLLFYEDVFDLNNNESKTFNDSKDIILNKMLEELVEKELEDINKNGSNYSKFLDNTIASKIIKVLLKKEDVQKYLRNIFLDIINDIIEMDNKNVFMEPNRIRDYLIKHNIVQDVNYNLNKNTKEKSKKKTHKKIVSNPGISGDWNNSFGTQNTISDFFNDSLENNIKKIKTSRITFNPDNNNKSSNFFTSSNISKMLFLGLTHSRLIYDIKEQKKFFNEDINEDNCYSYYKKINLDKFLEIEEKNPEINDDYLKIEMSQKELKNRLQSTELSKYMEEFYNNQIKELQRDSNKDFSNTHFVKLLKKNYLSYLDVLIPQYKINFEKIKFFIDKMIYKMLQYKDDKIPFCIRNIVYTIGNFFSKKGKDLGQIEINNYICEFFICKIIIPFLTNEELINLILGKNIDLESKTFLFYFAKIVKKIFRCNFYDSLEQHLIVFNIYLCEILPFINSIILNLLSSNNNVSKNSENQELKEEDKEKIKEDKENIKENNEIIKEDNENKKEDNENIKEDNENKKEDKEKIKKEENKSTKIIKYDSMIINEVMFILVFDFLVQVNGSDSYIIEKLFSTDEQLKENFKIISNNYYEIIQQIMQNTELLNKNNTNDINYNDNIFGGPFFILIKEDISKPNAKPITLSTHNQQLTHSEILPKIKYSFIKFFELMPSHFLNKSLQFHNNKSIIEILKEIKSIYAKTYISDYLNENNSVENENQIPFIMYLDYCLNYMIHLSDEYKNNDYELLFEEIKNDIKNEISFYQNDLSEYAFNLIIDNINEKIESMNNLFNFYNQNTFLNKINNYLFNIVKIKIDIYEYSYEDKIFLYNNKLYARDNKELNFIRNITIGKVSDFIKYISNHIINEDILNNFSELDNTSRNQLNQIDNINKFMDDNLTSIKNNIIEEYKKQIDINNSNNNNNIINDEEINSKEKENSKMDNIMNIIEELIHEKIYKKIWKNDKTIEDIQLRERCENKLKDLAPKNIGVNEKYINECIFQNIINLMITKYNINNYKTPNSKIKCVENIYKIINSSICIITNKSSRYSIDDIFPIFVYLLIKTKPECLFTNLNYIKLLIGKKNLIKSSGFALTQLEMAIQYLQNFE